MPSSKKDGENSEDAELIFSKLVNFLKILAVSHFIRESILLSSKTICLLRLSFFYKSFNIFFELLYLPVLFKEIL